MKREVGEYGEGGEGGDQGERKGIEGQEGEGREDGRRPLHERHRHKTDYGSFCNMLLHITNFCIFIILWNMI